MKLNFMTDSGDSAMEEKKRKKKEHNATRLNHFY